MSQTAQFACVGCARNYSWKPELAGKRVKCKCGTVVTVPDELVAPEPDSDALYDFAEIAAADERAAAEATARADAAGPVEARAKPIAKTAAATPAPALPAFAQTLGYQRGPTQREKDRFSNKTLIDMNRDAYVPAALLIFGLALYVANYANAYHLRSTGIAAVSVGLFALTLFKAAMLIGFALIVAGPLGVSFGGIFTAALKLAAIAVFSDGVTAWVATLITKLSGGFGAGMFTFPVSLGIYWTLLIYLFSMDPGDSWMVVVILSVFDFIIRNLALLLLLRAILGFGGVNASAISVPSLGGRQVTSALSDRTTYVNQMNEYKQMREARAYIADGHQAFLTQWVDKMYDAGAKNISFAVSKDINGKGEPMELYVEMPRNPVARKAIIDLRKQFYDANKFFSTPDDLLDEPEEPYAVVRIH